MNIDRPFMVELTERYARSLHTHGGDARVDDETASI
jgi:hypothetical protein